MPKEDQIDSSSLLLPREERKNEVQKEWKLLANADALLDGATDNFNTLPV